jgi:hypothetical protein
MRPGSWIDTCSVCDGTRFWTSKTGYQVCWWCRQKDPLVALVILARRQSAGAVKRAESWLQAYRAMEHQP